MPLTDMTQKSWFLIMCKPNQDARAESNLVRQGYEIYRPLARVPKIRGGKRIYVVESLFPRYIFIHLDRVIDNWGPIRSTLGVSGLVQFGPNTPCVPNELIALIKANEHEYEKLAFDLEGFEKNELVRISDGPLAGCEAIFQAIDGKERAILLISILGAQKLIKIPAEYVTRQ